MPKLSAGVLLYRARAGVVDVLLAHPGGPFWAGKDDGAWSIPKGEYTGGEDPWLAARREFPEVDRVSWFPVARARTKLLKGQRGFLDRLMAHPAVAGLSEGPESLPR